MFQPLTALVLLAVCIANINAQCSKGQTSTMEDPKDCGKYYTCSADSTALSANCPPGTKYNRNIERCDHVQNYNCSAEGGTCNANVTNRNLVKDDCCTQYYSCTHGMLSVNNCTAGTVFDPATRMCVSGTNCTNRGGCPVSNSAMVNCSAFAAHPTDPCKFQKMLADGSFTTQDCGRGTGWDQSMCTCVARSNCNSTADLRPQSAPGCMSQYNMDGTNSNGKPVWRDANGNLRSIWTDNGCTARTSDFACDGSSTSGMRVPYFSEYEYSDATCISTRVSPMTTATPQTSYDIFTNGDGTPNVGAGTISLRLTLTGSLTYTATLTVTSMSGQTVTLTASGNRNAADDWINIAFCTLKNELTGKISSSSQSAPTSEVNKVKFTSSQPLSTFGRIATSKGASNIASGSSTAAHFPGYIDEFKVMQGQDATCTAQMTGV